MAWRVERLFVFGDVGTRRGALAMDVLEQCREPAEIRSCFRFGQAGDFVAAEQLRFAARATARRSRRAAGGFDRGHPRDNRGGGAPWLPSS